MSDLATIQTDIVTQMSTDAYLATIPMITEEKADIDSQVEIGLSQGGVNEGVASKIGLAIVVLTPRGRAKDGSLPPVDLDLTTRISVYDSVLLNDDATNGQQKPGLNVVENILINLWQFSFGSLAGPKLQFIEFNSDEESGVVTYFLDFKLELQLTTLNT